MHSRFVVIQYLASAALMAAGMAIAQTGEPAWAPHVIDASSAGADGARLADVNGDGLMDITTGFEEGGVTKVFLNPGPARAKAPWPKVGVGSSPSVEDAVLVDLDGDGALDVVSCCEGKERRMHVFWAPKDAERTLEPDAWTREVLPASAEKMQWMFCYPMDIDGQGNIDLVAGGKNEHAAVGYFIAGAGPRDLAAYTWRALTPAGWIMTLRSADMDGDGDLDIVLSDRKGPMTGCRWLERPNADALTAPWENHYIGKESGEIMFMRLADIDGDGLEDAAVLNPRDDGQFLLLYRRLDATGDAWERHETPLPKWTGKGKAPAIADIDLDGKMDIVVTTERNDSADSEGVTRFSYTGTPWDGSWQPHRLSGHHGIKYDRIELLDLDADGDLDVITCEERAKTAEGSGGVGLFWYENPARP